MTNFRTSTPKEIISDLSDSANAASAAYMDAVQRSVRNFMETDPSLSARNAGDLVRNIPQSIQDFVDAEVRNARQFMESMVSAGGDLAPMAFESSEETEADKLIRAGKLFIERTEFKRASFDGLTAFLTGRAKDMSAADIGALIKDNFSVDGDGFVTLATAKAASVSLPDSVTDHLASVGFTTIKADVEYTISDEEKPSTATVALSESGKSGVLYYRVAGNVDRPETAENARVVAQALGKSMTVACIYMTNGTSNKYIDPKNGKTLDKLPTAK